MKACCVTGHRDLPPEKFAFVEKELRREIQEAIDEGFRTFISGFAAGVDSIFTKLVIEFRETYSDIFLEAALPYPGFRQRDREYKELIEKINGINVCSQKYSSTCFLVRNRYMISMSERVIAVYDGREKGGTVSTMRYAGSQGVEIRMIDI